MLKASLKSWSWSWPKTCFQFSVFGTKTLRRPFPHRRVTRRKVAGRESIRIEDEGQNSSINFPMRFVEKYSFQKENITLNSSCRLPNVEEVNASQRDARLQSMVIQSDQEFEFHSLHLFDLYILICRKNQIYVPLQRRGPHNLEDALESGKGGPLRHARHENKFVATPLPEIHFCSSCSICDLLILRVISPRTSCQRLES